MGRWIIALGCTLIVIGAIMHFAPGIVNWVGKLPGDIHIETGRTKLYIPITSMVLLSIILTILINLIRR